MDRKIKSVAVYCGHQFGKDPEYARAARKVGELLARNKITLVFGGGNVGLMGTVASAAIENGGKVIGISTTHVVSLQEPAHKDIDVKIVNGLSTRKEEMYELSDAFVILPGGIGRRSFEQIPVHKPIMARRRFGGAFQYPRKSTPILAA